MEVFDNQEFGSIRLLQEAGKTFFCASDVAKALGYVNPYAAVKRHCRGPLTKREGVVQKVNQYGDAGEQVVEISFITEGDVYRLIVHSKLPSAERFEHWVFDEVLPSIRKHGVYMSDSILDQVIQHPEVIYLYALSLIWANASNEMKFIITAFILRATKMNKVHMHNFLFGGGGWNAGYLTGVIYFPSLSVETSIIELLKERLKNVSKAFAEVPTGSEAIISTQSASMLENIPNDSIDYIFTDPPFGDNLMYSELNSIWESWLRVYTNNEPEAVMNRTQGKQLAFYQEAMTKCFSEFERILKPNRWMTVEFHNSKNAVWNSIQTSLNRAGFIIADVRTLNKNQGSFNQVKGASQAIKQDLVISAYKPKESFRKDFQLHAGSVDTAWDFVRQHLANIPVVVVKNDHIEVVAERQAYLLFDRMVAYHIMQGIPVPLDATDFYRGLDEKFLKRDNMYFLPDQVNEYDTARITTEVENIQFEMFVTNEKSAISWLYQQLDEQFCGPQTYAELQPKFMQEVKAVDKYEQMPELATILEENFLQDEKPSKWRGKACDSGAAGCLCAI